MAEHEHVGLRTPLFSRTGLVLLGFLVFAGYFLWHEHAAHLEGFGPLFLVLGLYAGMHFFMHVGHGADHRSLRTRQGEDDR